MVFTTPKDWPQFSDPLLQTLSQAVLSRRKAIGHKAATLLVSEGPEGQLSIEIGSLDPRPVRVRLFVWPDQAMWFHACQASKNGWTFEFSFRGTIVESASSGVVGQLEESFSVICQLRGTDDCVNKVLQVWNSVSPVLEDAA